jgi:GMP synthase (glutamine-hydrolysing)
MQERTAVILRHVQFEGLGVIEPLLKQRAYKIKTIEAGVSALGDLLLEADLLVVLGGPISVNDEVDYPFLTREIALIKRRLMAKKPILGICLGAQIIAKALGSTVEPMQKKEIGFYPISLTDAGKHSALRFLDEGSTVLHWHGEQFDIPHQAKQLAKSENCDNQAFAIGHHVLAIQFHIEVDAQMIEQWLIGHTVELHAHHIDVNQLRTQAKQYQAVLKGQAVKVFNDWLDHLNI